MQDTKTILPNETQLDLLIRSVGSVEGLFDLAALNAISPTDEPAAGTAMAMPILPMISTRLNGPLPKSAAVVEKVTALPMQAPSDIVIQEAGSMEGLFDLALLNGVSITGDIENTELIKGEVLEPLIVRYLTGKGVNPACVDPKPKQKGIGYMQIGTSFIVS